MTENIKISVISPSIRPAGLEITRQCLANQTFKSFEWLVEIGTGNKHDLNQAFNRCLKRAKGEIVVFLQDYIKIEPDALQKVVDTFKGKFTTYPVGKTDKIDYSGDIKWDWRMTRDEGEISWNYWEIDFGACLLSDIKQIGGFDEELDNYWSCDNVNVGCRADLAGYKFELIKIPAIAYDHDAFIEHPFRKNYHPSFNNERMDMFRRGLKLTLK